ncbi:Vps16, C-terminal region-domain-containing protein [Bisporella sp. PMI_857]|nr:Vps16, C-terminal region-domain-containing protein [Bisporella sp. PMI_857]
MESPTADWEKVGDKFYRKIQLYTEVFDKDLELENYIVTGCSYGGAIALYRDESKLHSLQGSQSSKASIDLYSCAGKLIRRLNWDKGSIKGLGWSDDEQLIIVTADGTVRCYYDLQGDFTQFSLGNGAEEYGVIACRFYGSGFAALLSNNHLISVPRYEEPRPTRLATPPEGDVHSWTIIPPAYTLSRSVEVLLSISQTIYVVDAAESEDRQLDIGPFTHLSVSPNGKLCRIVHWRRQSDTTTGLQWCGNDAVVIAWDDEVHVNRGQTTLRKYFYDGRVHLIADHDGIRLITNDICDFLQKVPEVTDEVKAAGLEFNIHWQKQLLKAASFGKSSLRVLNAVRFYEIGLPLSYDQFVRLTPEKLVRRLINRREYLSFHRIYVHWASQKVRVSSEDEDTICRMIVEKLAGKRGISFEEIARAAYDEGRGRLATELLNHEPRAGKQVPLSLIWKKMKSRSIKPSRAEIQILCFFVVLHLKKKLQLSAFFRVINSRPTATALIEASAQADDSELLKDLYYQDDRRIDGANVFIREALKQNESRSASDKLSLAVKLLSDSKETAFEVKSLQEATTSYTIFKLVRLGYTSRVKKMQSEFKIPDKTFWWIRLRALVAKRDWNELEELSKTRKSPIGWEPFFNLILAAGNPKLAALFIPKAAPSLKPGEAISMYEKCGMRIKAAEEAVKVKDIESLDRLRQAAGIGSVEGREIERIGAGLRR